MTSTYKSSNTSGSVPGQPRRRPPVPTVADIVRAVTTGQPAVRITAYDGSAVGPDDDGVVLHVATERGLSYLLTAPGDLGMARAYVSGDLELRGAHPGDPYEALHLLSTTMKLRVPSASEGLARARGLGWERLRPPAPPPQEAIPQWRRTLRGLRHSR